MVYFEILLIRHQISPRSRTALTVFLIFFPRSSILLLALGESLNIQALLLNILVWKLDFNFLRIFSFFGLRMFRFPRSIFLFYESNIFKTLSTNRIWNLFCCNCSLLDESTRASIKAQHRPGSLNGSNLFFSQLFLMNILIPPSFHSGSPLLPAYFIFFLILCSPANEMGDGSTPVSQHIILIRKLAF